MQPYGGTYLSRGQYHSLEHIFVQEALDNLGADCISVSASGDNTTYRFVVTGRLRRSSWLGLFWQFFTMESQNILQLPMFRIVIHVRMVSVMKWEICLERFLLLLEKF